MVICERCGRNLKKGNDSNQHKKVCDYLLSIRNNIIAGYLNDNKSLRELKKEYHIQYNDIRNILGGNKRTLGESSILARKKFPEKYITTEETKEKIRVKRIEYMKANPEKTAWRSSTISYPEKLFLDKLKSTGADLKYSIIREYSIFPYFIDFAFMNEKIAVEIDGSQHLKEENALRDIKKDELLKSLDWSVIRITEKEIKKNIEYVFASIEKIIKDKASSEKYQIGILTLPKERIKEKRNKYGLTEKQYSASLKNRIVERPSKIELDDLRKLKTYKEIGEIYKVSGKSIEKWIKYYNKINGYEMSTSLSSKT